MLSPRVLGIACTALFITALHAQSEPVGRVESLSHAIHAVGDLDRTLAFYRDAFGIDGQGRDFDNPGVPLLTNAPGVTLRMSMLALPGGARLELTHFKGLDREPARADYADPGVASLVLQVRDLDGVLSAARAAGAEIVTTGDAPLEIETHAGTARSIVVRDPDGYFLQLIEPVEHGEEGDATGVIDSVSLALTMQDAAATQRFYTGMLGIELNGDESFVRDEMLAKLFGLPPDTELRRLSGVLPPDKPVVFTEFRGIPRSKFDPRVRDPGAPALAVLVGNIDGMLEQMRGAGVPVLSTNGELVDFGGGVRTIFVEDPNGLNIEIFERPAPAQR
jgi:catechol 2,3-dioxygenase-like lactoylglutathione lyase family enzyme